MAGAATLKTLGEWDKEVGVGLRDALAVSMDVMGRTGEEACKHALILMAQSARAITTKAKSKRPIMRDARLHGAEYVDAWQQGKAEPVRVHKFRFGDGVRPEDRIPGTWANAQKVGNRGLASRAWMWGLAKLKPGMHTGKAIPGTSRVYSISGEQNHGYIKEVRLGYILKAMPAGWEASVELAATNKVMAQARNKLEGQWRREMSTPKVKGGPTPSNAMIAQYFLKGL
jgi:hypothetical protein